jgi:hypothetical protein
MYLPTEVSKKDLNHGLQRGIKEDATVGPAIFFMYNTDMHLVTRIYLCSCRESIRSSLRGGDDLCLFIVEIFVILLAETIQ